MIYVEIRDVAGCKTIRIPDEDLKVFRADEDAYAAVFYGVDKELYLKWLERGGFARCGSKTKTGKRCRNYVSGSGQLSIREWIELEGSYCAIHGGPTSEEANTLR